MESEVLGSILTKGNILSLEFLFSRSKASDPNSLHFRVGHHLIYPEAYRSKHYSDNTLKKHQRTLTFVTVSKVSAIENEWWLMGILYFESFLRNKLRVVGNNIV